MADFLTTLQQFAGGREGCFESAATKVDAVAVCHEVRSVPLSSNEVLVSDFRVLNQRQPMHNLHDRKLLSADQTINLKSLQIDAVVQLTVYAQDRDSGAIRSCGEVRIPLRTVVTKYDQSLYHTWVTLDTPGLNDSVASIGLMDGIQGVGEAFAHAMNNAPRQLSQPKACISLCKATDLDPSGHVLWTEDLPRKDRISRWGPMLRSQQQHIVMCAAQHHHQEQDRPTRESQQDSAQLRALLQREEQQVKELEILRANVRERRAQQASQQQRSAAAAATKTKTKMKMKMKKREEFDEQVRSLKLELEQLSVEANKKIEEGNVRIEQLRQERDMAAEEADREFRTVQKLQERKVALASQRAMLAEEKERMMKTLEDVYEDCRNAGVPLDGTSLAGLQFG
eukprot:CAMPEP_0206449060 /NCGR_PEP_ID=MMETSP0324_2-20121206/17865_1 /ASSEMBLY_ACC=CAM_ASM_000836 /TAXON_ID=2866 /ORGANISM="Crypthecodinium cohnii, Strain Seligo" /LENGTH=396 /DNA_ID=CAMNT_0053918367 /DNA_START=27 /DNA_END=1220 /DNA_ORIENTATION=+